MQVGIIALGSIIMGDDAFGAYVLQFLKANYIFPSEIELLDLGTPGPEFVNYMARFDAVIVLDAVKAKGDPGEVHLYRQQDIAKILPSLRLSPHDPSLRDALLAGDFIGEAPDDVLLVGVIPSEVELQTTLSEPVMNSIPEVEEAVISELRRLGFEPERLSQPSALDIWWE
ncbi:MAG: hydrogenase maturation protease [Thermoanaerobaculia bacterium]|jgi:hydrogenase maturation protease